MRKHVEQLLRMALIFKQASFELMELKLNFSEIMVRLGYKAKLNRYVKAVCYFTRRIDKELSGNRNLILKWNYPSKLTTETNTLTKEKKHDDLSISNSRISIDETVTWPSIVNKQNLANRMVLNALEYCFMKGKSKEGAFELFNRCHSLI